MTGEEDGRGYGSEDWGRRAREGRGVGEARLGSPELGWEDARGVGKTGAQTSLRMPRGEWRGEPWEGRGGWHREGELGGWHDVQKRGLAIHRLVLSCGAGRQRGGWRAASGGTGRLLDSGANQRSRDKRGGATLPDNGAGVAPLNHSHRRLLV